MEHRVLVDSTQNSQPGHPGRRFTVAPLVLPPLWTIEPSPPTLSDAPCTNAVTPSPTHLAPSLEEDEDRERGITPMYVRYDARLYGPRQPGKREPLSIPFLKKYVAFAKQRFAAPELTPEASDAIAEYYADLRTSPEVKALPVTVRTLETLIRLSCAHAKVCDVTGGWGGGSGVLWSGQQSVREEGWSLESERR